MMSDVIVEMKGDGESAMLRCAGCNVPLGRICAGLTRTACARVGCRGKFFWERLERECRIYKVAKRSKVKGAGGDFENLNALLHGHLGVPTWGSQGPNAQSAKIPTGVSLVRQHLIHPPPSDSDVGGKDVDR